MLKLGQIHTLALLEFRGGGADDGDEIAQQQTMAAAAMMGSVELMMDILTYVAMA